MSSTPKLQLEENGNAEDRYGMTPVCRAIKSGNKDLVLAYIKQGLNMNYRNSVDGVTPFIRACNTGNIDMVNFLIDNVDNLNVSLTDEHGYSALYYSCQYGNHEIVRLLLQRTKPRIDLHTIEKGLPTLKDGVLKELIDTYKAQNTCISDLLEMMAKGPVSLELLRYATGGPTDPNDPYYYTDNMFLCMCKSNGNEELLTRLLTENDKFKSRLNTIVDDTGRTPLIVAVMNQAVSIVKLLLEHGASPYVKDNSGYNAINCANNSYDDGADYMRLRDPPEDVAQILKLLNHENP